MVNCFLLLPPDALSIRWEPDRRAPQTSLLQLVLAVPLACLGWDANQPDTPEVCISPRIHAVIQGCGSPLMLAGGLQSGHDGFSKGASRSAGWHSAHPPIPQPAPLSLVKGHDFTSHYLMLTTGKQHGCGRYDILQLHALASVTWSCVCTLFVFIFPSWSRLNHCHVVIHTYICTYARKVL